MRRCHLIRIRFSRWGRVGLVCLTLLGFAIGTVGIPVPVPVPTGSNPEQFICQGHGCGCQTAEHCWRACCCFSPKKRLEWAAKNQVAMPVALMDQLLEDADDSSGNSLCAAPSRLGASGSRGLAQQNRPNAAKPGDTSTPRPARHSGSSGSNENSHSVTWYSVILARKCQGAGSTLLLLSDPLSVPASPDDWQAPEFTQSLAPEAEPRLCSLFWTPPVPPG